jgi:hypothetical protein
MSNPFATFRKNRNYWMAALVLLAILAFVVAPAIDQASRAFRGSGSENAVAVRWNGGKMTVADLQNTAQKHGSLVRFLTALAREVIEAGGEPKVPGFFYDPQSKQILGLGIQVGSDEETICRTRILADEAKRLGVEFDDQAIDDFLIAYCDSRIPTERLAKILYEASDGRLSNFEVRELLKKELAAMVVQRTAMTAFYTHAPGETYQDFLKLNRTAKVDAFPVFVADYVSKVTGQPTESEIQAIYDAGITRIANPNSPEPGLVRPYQANIEYVEANMQEWTNRQKSLLTEEQLRAEYDRQAALGQLQVPVTADDGTGESPGDSPAASEAAPGDKQPAVEEGAAGNASDAEQPADATEPDTTPVAEPEPSSLEPSEPEQPSADALELSPPAENAAKEEAGNATPSPGDQSSRNDGRQHYVALLQEEAASAGFPPPVVQPPQLDPDAQQTATQLPAAPAMRTQTFEEAREGIADSLARDAAITSLEAAMKNLYDNVMNPYFGAYQLYAAFRDAEIKDEEDAVEEPVKPNLKKLAEEAGLTYGQTGLTDGFRLSQTQVGRGNIRQDESGISGQVANAAMDPSVKLFKPFRSNYFDQEALRSGQMPEFFQYLVWKSEERQAYVPELAEVREEIVDIWKRQQARTLAENAARELSKKIGSGEDPWAGALSTAEQALIVEPEPFTWISRFGEYNMTSTVPKLEAVGDAVGNEFMQNVFATQSGQATVAPNQNRSIYYVVRLLEFAPEEDSLRQRFADDPVKAGANAITREQSDRMTRDWFESLYNELGVEWQTTANQL